MILIELNACQAGKAGHRDGKLRNPSVLGAGYWVLGAGF
jgi:hypothetical protein